jgi:hypothetical protein
VAAEASAAAVAAVSVHGTGTALGMPDDMPCAIVTSMHCVIEATSCFVDACAKVQRTLWRDAGLLSSRALSIDDC